MTLRRHTTIGASATHAMLLSYRGIREFLRNITGEKPNDEATDTVQETQEGQAEPETSVTLEG